MFDGLYRTVLDMSRTASIVIGVILVARLFLRKAPKVFSYALWAVVLFRLLCPVALEAPFSVIPRLPEASGGYALAEASVSFAAGNGMDILHVSAMNGKYIWAAGIAVMLVYAAISYGKSKHLVAASLPFRDNIWIADDIRSPFVMGFLTPGIYLPRGLGETEREYIILHEQHHIHRGDPIWKALAFLALAIHWFNPLVWTAFILAGRDMEMSCDEAVIRRAGPDIRADYSASLLTFATGRRIIAGAPPSFGEGDTKGRIRNLAGWKKPARWSVALRTALCLVLGLCLITDPAADLRLQEIDGMGRYGFADSKTVRLISHGRATMITDLEDFYTDIRDVTVSRLPASESGADSSHMILLEHNRNICFSEDYETAWLDNGDAPAAWYVVRDPEKVEAFFLKYLPQPAPEALVCKDIALESTCMEGFALYVEIQG